MAWHKRGASPRGQGQTFQCFLIRQETPLMDDAKLLQTGRLHPCQRHRGHDSEQQLAVSEDPVERVGFKTTPDVHFANAASLTWRIVADGSMEMTRS